MKCGSINQIDFGHLKRWKGQTLGDQTSGTHSDRLYAPSGMYEDWEFLAIPSRPETDIITLWIAELLAHTIYRHRRGGNGSILVPLMYAYKISAMACMSVVSIICLVTTVALGHADNGWLRLVIMGTLDIALCAWAVFAGRTELFMLLLTYVAPFHCLLTSRSVMCCLALTV